MNELQKRVINSIYANKLIVIIRGISDDKIIPTVGALIDGGAKLVEITFDHTDSESLMKAPRQIAAVKEHFGDAVEIGAGTVLDCSDIFTAQKAGATFMISPNTDENVIRGTKKLGLVSIPGAYTPTEICNAYSWGADFVKLFPLSKNSGEYIKAVKAPLKHIPLLAVGGVTPENAEEFFSAGACGVGVGSSIVNASQISLYENESDFSAVSEQTQKFVKAIQRLGK